MQKNVFYMAENKKITVHFGGASYNIGQPVNFFG